MTDKELKQQKDYRREIANLLLEFKHSEVGKFLMQWAEMEISILCNNAMVGKKVIEENNYSVSACPVPPVVDFECLKIEEFERYRGQILGLQKFLDLIESEIQWLKRQKEVKDAD